MSEVAPLFRTRECVAYVLIARQPIKSPVEQWLTREQIEDIPTMLSKRAPALDARTIAEHYDWFEPNGKFPAVGITDERLEHHA